MLLPYCLISIFTRPIVKQKSVAYIKYSIRFPLLRPCYTSSQVWYKLARLSDSRERDYITRQVTSSVQRVRLVDWVPVMMCLVVTMPKGPLPMSHSSSASTSWSLTTQLLPPASQIYTQPLNPNYAWNYVLGHQWRLVAEQHFQADQSLSVMIRNIIDIVLWLKVQSSTFIRWFVGAD